MTNSERLMFRKKIARRRLKRSATKIKDLTKSQQTFLLSLFYGLSDCCEELTEEWVNLYMKFVNQYGLQNHCDNIINCYIQRLEQKNLLHKIDDSQDYRTRIDYVGKLSAKYKEDEDVLKRALLHIECKSETEVNLIRIFSVTDSLKLTNLIGWTFFCKSVSDGEFDFNQKVSVKYKKYMKNRSVNKIKIFSNLFDFSEEEEFFLLISYYMMNQDFKDFTESIRFNDDNYIKIMTVFFNNDYRLIKNILRDDGKLRGFGLVNNDSFLQLDFKDCVDLQSIDSLFSDIVSEDNLQEVYDLDSFSVKPEHSKIVMSFLKSSKRSNILFYGAAGAGKTEYARSVVKKLNKKAFVFKCKDLIDDKRAPLLLERLNCLMSIKNDDSVIIVDEAECVLKTQMSFFQLFGISHNDDNSAKKSLINSMFDLSKNHVIWILNYTNQIDSSTLRRFTFSIPFEAMSKSMLERIAMSKLSKLQLQQNILQQIVDYCGQYNVTGASVENVVNIVQCLQDTESDENIIIQNVKNVLEANSALLYGKAKMRDKVKTTYNLSVLNTSENAEKIVEMVQNAIEYSKKNKCSDNGIRMLFYGVSGTGKTEFARYIAEKLNKKILLKRASDILDAYVGQNEKNIKNAFIEAQNSDSILLFDEADSFFSDRNDAVTSWERTMVNEFLTQMEEFSGILICTTNLRKIMDPAMERRFHIKTEFKPLTEHGIRTLLSQFFADYTFSDDDIQKLTLCNTVTPGDFGTLQGKIRFMNTNEINSDFIFKELYALQNEKNKNGNICKIGFC